MMSDDLLVSPSRRKKKQADEISIADSTTTQLTFVSEDGSEASTAGTELTEDDGLPHPRVCSHPF